MQTHPLMIADIYGCCSGVVFAAAAATAAAAAAVSLKEQKGLEFVFFLFISCVIRLSLLLKNTTSLLSLFNSLILFLLY